MRKKKLKINKSHNMKVLVSLYNKKEMNNMIVHVIH